MRGSGKITERTQFLSGWKEIGNYLGKGVRTVQRYERELGLPVRRPAGKTTGSVLATKAELDAWVTASPIRDQFKLGAQEGSYATAMTTSIKTGVAEMVRLRSQMTELRNELRISVQLLRDSLFELHGDLHAEKKSNAPREELRSLTLVEPKQRNDYMLQLMDLDSRGKAS